MEWRKKLGMPCLMGKNKQKKAKLTDKLKELKEYANNLLNVENKWHKYLINAHVEEHYERFIEEDVRKA